MLAVSWMWVSRATARLGNRVNTINFASPAVDRATSLTSTYNPTKRPTQRFLSDTQHGQLQRPQPRQHPAHLLLAAPNPLGRRWRQPSNPVCPVRLRANFTTASQRSGRAQRCRQTTTAIFSSPGPNSAHRCRQTTTAPLPSPGPSPVKRCRQTTTTNTNLPPPTAPNSKPRHPNTTNPETKPPHTSTNRPTGSGTNPAPPPRPNHRKLHLPLPNLHKRHLRRRGPRPGTLPALPRRPRLCPPHSPQHTLPDVASLADLTAPVV